MNINHISVSRLQLYQQCEQRYKYRYHLKLIPEGEVPFHLTYGKIIHKVAEIYTKNQGKQPIQEIVNQIISGQILLEANHSVPVLNEEYKLKLPEHLRHLNGFIDRTGYDGYLEYEFNIDLEPPYGIMLKGFIDRLIIKKDNYFILDYKTTKNSKWRKNSNNIHDDFQLNCYAMVIQKIFGAKAENIHAALYYVDGNELASTRFKKDSLINVEKTLIQSFKQIKNKNPDQTIGTIDYWCNYCEYQKICPFFRNNH
jgi:ATP-dependent exoDNAse (exonuclease V) beta subunit